MRNKNKSILSLAVAHASMALAIEASAASFVVTSDADSGAGSLRAAIEAANLNADSADIITIDASAISTIELDSPLFHAGPDAMIISAPVDDAGNPQVTITASGGGFPLLEIAGEGGAPTIISGLTFTGADNSGAGGAIDAIATTLVLDKSVVTGNTAVGLGGGILLEEGELCLQGSVISENTVTEGSLGDIKYAIGGGVAVDGVANVVPSGGGAPDCLTSSTAQATFTAFSAEFASAAASLAGNPDGIESIPSEISGNTALIEGNEDFDGNKYLAAGGGIAILNSDLAIQESVLVNASCEEPKYGEEQCSIIVGAAITGNEAKGMIETFFDGEFTTNPSQNVVAGGGVFLGLPGTNAGQQLDMKYSQVSGNKATLEGASGTFSDIVVGAGIGAINSIELNAAVSGELGEGGGPPSVSQVNVLGSIVSGNTATMDVSPGEEVYGAQDFIAGGGIGVIDLWDPKYDRNPTFAVVTSAFSTISGNTLDVSASALGPDVAAFGAGVAAGVNIKGINPTSLKYGTYYGAYSGNSDNSIIVAAESGLGEQELVVAGGGVAAASQFIYGKKPEFTIVSSAESEDKYGLPLQDTLFTSPGGITGNLLDVSGGGEGLTAVVSGAGSVSPSKYGQFEATDALIAGNDIAIDAGTADGRLHVAGGGLAMNVISESELDGEGVYQDARFTNSKVSGNTITVAGGGPGFNAEAIGGGIGLAADAGNFFYFGEFEEGPGLDQTLDVRNSEISGNLIDIQSEGEGEGIAVGAGIAANASGEYGPDHITVRDSTIANNSVAVASDGYLVSGAGMFLLAKYNAAVFNTTIVGNTGSDNGTPEGGQLAFISIDGGGEGGLRLHNSLISGDVAQGPSDVKYDFAADLDVSATAVFHQGVEPELSFLAPELADPAFLGPLQFNGSDFAADEGGAYGFVTRTSTIALLDGSGAIDPTDGGCLTGDGGEGEDQRGYSRDACLDLGAYEFLAEEDEDGLTDGAELDAPGTNPDLVGEMAGFFPNEPFSTVLESGDGNSDGIPDVDQPDVASFTTDAAGALTLFVVDSEYDLADVEPIAGTSAGGFDLSLGGISFTVLTGDDTDPVELSLIAPANGMELSLVKQVCNPMPVDPEEGWEVLDDSPEPFGPDRVRFNFTLEPGGPFDCNGDADNIEDPIFIAQSAPAAPPAPTASGGATAPVAIPVLPTAFSALLTGAIAVLGLAGLRPRRNRRGR